MKRSCPGRISSTGPNSMVGYKAIQGEFHKVRQDELRRANPGKLKQGRNPNIGSTWDKKAPIGKKRCSKYNQF